MDDLKFPCPCCSGHIYPECCLPLHNGEKKAPTAEALMRARYSAYVCGDVDYIVKTHNPDRMDEIDRDSIAAWSEGSEWLGLEILNKEAGEEKDSNGHVEFIARYSDQQGKIHSHHEKSTFFKRNGEWFFADGEVLKARPIARQEPKVGRNDDCPCGSGKKYKKCCMK